MPIDHSLVVPIILGVLGCNVLCLLGMLLLRPARRLAAAVVASSPLPPFRACLAEFLGTFLLVFVALLAAHSGQVVSALAIGAAVAAMSAALGRYSGGHFNPAVTLGVVAVGRLHPLLAIAYWLAQAAGAAAAAFALAGSLSPEFVSAAVPAPVEPATPAGAVILEAVVAFLLVMAVVGCGEKHALLQPLAVGLALAAGSLAISPYSGAAINPARYFGPALVAQNWTHWVVYVAGPCLGGSFAAVLLQFVFLDSSEDAATTEDAARPEERAESPRLLPWEEADEAA